MTNLVTMSCRNSATISKLDDCADLLKQVPEWKISGDNKFMSRRFEFKNFKQTMFFINALAYVCEQECHHPDAKFGFNYCEVVFTTHDVNGLSINDFICAAKVDALIHKAR